jgi:aspartyl protease family protein
VLERHGLVEQRSNWVLPLELEMRQALASLPKRRQELQRAQQAADHTYRMLVQSNAAVELQVAQLHARLHALKAQDISGLGSGQRKLLGEQINRIELQIRSLQKQWIVPADLGGFAPLKKQLIDLTNCRNELATTVLTIREHLPSVSVQYEQLAQDPQIAKALAALGGRQRLGPLDDYRSKTFLARIADYERDVFTSEIPLYKDSGNLRVSGLINRTPVTFTWRESSEPTMLTASVIEAAGLQVPQNAPQLPIRLADGSQVTVRQFEVPYMRFGNQVLRGVTAYALPPEAENAGTQIGPLAFEGVTAKAEPQNLRLRLE